MQPVIAAALYLLAVARIPALLRFGKDTVFFAGLLSGTAALLTTPAVYVFVDQLVGGRNLTKLALHTLLVLGLWQLRIGVLHAISTDPKRRHSKYGVIALYLTLVLQAVFFFAADVGATTTQFGHNYNTRPAGALFSATVLSYIGFVCVELALVCRRFVPRMHGLFRVGFTMVGIGSAVGVLSAVLMTLDVLANAMPGMAMWNFHSTPLYQVVQLIPIGLIGPGLSIPAWAGRAERKRTERWEQETLARVQPIQVRALQTAGMDRTLETDASAPAQEKLHRLIVEIRDAELAMGGDSVLTPDERAYLLTVEHKLDLERTS
jgi:hypothetical protein